MKKYGIRKVKTWYGLKYGVVDLTQKDVTFVHSDRDSKVKTTVSYKAKEIDVVEIKGANGIPEVALYPLTEDGLDASRLVAAQLNRTA